MPRQKGIAWQAGVPLADVVLALGLPAAVVARERKRLEQVVAAGHAKFRTEVAKRLRREGVFKGRAHSLLALGRMHLGLDSRQSDPHPGAEVLAAVAGAGERLLALLNKIETNRAMERAADDEA